jgi:hypothetical protein
MEAREIKLLLNKFYEGATSNKEENILKEYFLNYKDIPAELEEDKLYFTELGDYKNESLPDFDLEKELTSLIDNQEAKVIRLKSTRSWVLRIAASIVILLGSYFFIENYIAPKPIDTYDNPELAYLETKKALLYVSQKLNGGTEELKNLEKLTESLENLSKLKEFDKATNMVKTQNR